MALRSILLFFLLARVVDASCQKLKRYYRTVRDENLPMHYLIFSDKENVTLLIPNMHNAPGRRVNLKYRVKQDTITFMGNRQTANPLEEKVLNSHFVIRTKKVLYDYQSGVPYIDRKLVNDKLTVVSINGRIYKIGKNKNRRLAKRAKGIDAATSTFKILRGKPAYDKYGIVGMNAVIELETKE